MNSISLFDRKYTGGLDSARGYHFEDGYVLSQLPYWLSSDDLEKFQQELLTDLELFFGSGRRWFIQIKNHRVSPSEFQEIVRDFNRREATSQGQYEKFIIVSAGLSQPLAVLQRNLERFRAAKDYTETELAASRQQIAVKLGQVNCDDLTEFIIKKVYFHSDVEWVKDQEVVRDRFVGSLVRRYEIHPKSADDIYFRIAQLLVVERGKPVPVLSIRTAIEQKQLEDQANRLTQFDLVTIEFLDRYRVDNAPSFFFDGAVPTWADIVHRRDIPREMMNDIISRVEGWKEGKLLVPILAEGGEGKSTLLRRIAVELATRGNVVLYHRRDNLTLEVKELEWVAGKTNKGIYVFIDDAPRVQNFSDLIKSLSELSSPLVLIVAARPYEWEPLRSAVYSANLAIELAPNGREIFLEGLTDHEIELVFRLLIDTGIIPSLSDEELKTAIDVYAQSSKRKLFVLVLELTQGKRAKEVVRNEIERVRAMGNDLYTAYRYICLMSSIHSFLILPMLQKLITTDNIGLDIAQRLSGLVEVIGDKIYVRHDKIGELATDIMFEGADEQRGDSLCKLISLAFEVRQIDAIKSINSWSAKRLIPQSQIFKVLNHLTDEAYCAGEYDLIKAIFRDPVNSGEIIEDFLVAKTPLIWERLVFPYLKRIFVWDKIQDSWNLIFLWPPCIGQTDNLLPGAALLEIGLQWADIYGGMVRWGTHEPKRKQFFRQIVVKMYELLATVHEEESAKINLQYAEHLRADWSEEDSIKLYEKVLEKMPNSAEAHLGLAVSLYLSGNYDKALHHYRLLRELNWDLVFYMGEDDIFIEMFERLGLWEELIELRKEAFSSSIDLTRRLRQSEMWKITSILSKLSPDPNERNQDRIREPLNISDEDIQIQLENLDRLLEFAKTLPEEQQIELGQKFFGSSWFGELRQGLSNDGISSVEYED